MIDTYLKREEGKKLGLIKWNGEVSMQRIVPVDNHFEAYSEYGQYLCQGDTWDDCAENVVKMIKQEANRSTLLYF